MGKKPETEAEVANEPAIAWIYLAVCCYNLWLFGGLFKSVGILFVELLDLFGEGPTATSGLQTVSFICYTISTPVSSYAASHFSLRRVEYFAAVVGTAGLLIAAFSPSLTVFIIGYGVITGFSQGTTVTPMATTITMMFKRHRNLANGCLFASASLGGLCMPLLYSFLIEAYTLRGTLVITAGLWLHLMVVGTVADPIVIEYLKKLALGLSATYPYTTSKKNKSEAIEKEVVSHKDEIIDNNNQGACDEKELNVSESVFPLEEQADESSAISHYKDTETSEKIGICNPAANFEEIDLNIPDDNRLKSNGHVTQKGENTCEDSPTLDSKVAHTKLNHVKDGPPSVLNGISNTMKEQTTTLSKEELHQQRAKSALKTIEKEYWYLRQDSGGSLSLDKIKERQLSSEEKKETMAREEPSDTLSPCLRSLRAYYVTAKNCMFWRYVLFNLPSSAGYISSLVYLPVYGTEMGLNRAQASTLLSMVGGMEMVGRLFYGYVGDLRWTDRRIIISMGYWTCGGLIMTLTFIHNNYVIYLLAVTISLCGGIHMIYTFPLYSEIIEPHHLAPAMGLSQACTGVMMAGIQPALGLLAGTTGTYSWALRVGAVMYIAGATFCILSKVPLRRCHRKPSSYPVNA